jgi:hypothetical protein
MRTLVETMWCGLETKIAEVTDDFIQGLDLTWCELKIQLEEVEDRASQGVGSSTETMLVE